jgi:hypothetical protein
MKKNKSKITKSDLDSFNAEEPDNPIGKFILLGTIIILIIGAIFMAATTKTIPAEELNSTCNCTYESNFTTYDIPAEIPNISKVIADPLCNDFCYVQACKYGCGTWINHGLMAGKCQCDLQNCIINIGNIYNESG